MPRTPRNRTHPAFDSFPLLSEWHWWVSTLVDTMNMATTETGFVESSHARLLCLNTLDASADNGEDGGWFFWLALHGATHP
jgi:hypothetical protein